MKEIQAIIRALNAPGGTASALATLVSAEGSSYRRPGARLLLAADGTRVGSISGGCLEDDVLTRARAVLANGRADTVIYDTTSENDLVWGVGLGCHGVVRVLIERLPPNPTWAAALAENFAARRATALAVTHEAPDVAQLGTRLADRSDSSGLPAAGVFIDTIAPPVRLVIFGAGDDAQPLARLAHELGWLVTIADPRAAYATSQRFPSVASVVVAPAEELAARTAIAADTLVVVMTHHYLHDVPLLRALLPLSLTYLGLLGPRKRAERILDDLAREGVALTPAQRARLHAPVGLDIGADSPEQVALAIVAEMQAVLTRRDARPLQDRTRPIHG